MGRVHEASVRHRWGHGRQSLLQYLRVLILLPIVSVAGVSLVTGCDGETDLSLSTPAIPLGKADAAGRSGHPDVASDLPNSAAVELALLNAVNAERVKHHLRPVRSDPTLDQLADFYACRMIEGGFFGHQDPFDGSTVDVRAVNFGYAYRKVGENLAAGHESVAEVMAHWMSSPLHRANILDPVFTDLGVAVKIGGEYGIYWVEEFGRPLTSPQDAPEGKTEEAAATTEHELEAGSQATTGSAASAPSNEPAAEGAAHPADSATTNPAAGTGKSSR